MVTEIKQNEIVKGILIDPEKETVTEIELTRDAEGSVLKELYRVIGCQLVDVLREAVNNRFDDIWIDDEALLKDPHHLWALPGMSNYMAGRGVILSYNNDGGCESHTLTERDLKELRRVVKFAHCVDTYTE